jgi:hypothetical protein
LTNTFKFFRIQIIKKTSIIKGHLKEALKIKDLVEVLKQHLKLKVLRVALGNEISLGKLYERIK